MGRVQVDPGIRGSSGWMIAAGPRESVDSASQIA